MENRLNLLLEDKGKLVHTTTPQTSIHDCVKKFCDLKIGALLVIDNDELVGMISERDITQKLVYQGLDIATTKVADIMTTEIIVVTPDMTVTEAMQLITEKRIRHLPVVESGKVIGLISIGDLTRWAMLAQTQEISLLTEYIRR